MLTCREVSKLVSEALEHPLPFRTRMGVHLHLMMCSMCRIYKKQSLFLRKLLTNYTRHLADDDSVKMPPTTAQRIKKTLADEADSGSGNESKKDV